MSQAIDPAVLTKNLGGAWYRSYGVAPCPVCQSTRRKDQNALTITAEGGKLLLHCKKNDCAFTDILTGAGLKSGTVEFDQMAMAASDYFRVAQAAKLKARARSLWGHGQPIQGTKGAAYLKARGITCALPDSLRWLPDTYHGPSGRYCAALIADVHPTGGVHRTFFTKNGHRLEKSAKMMLGPCAGGAVHLSEADGPLVVCEGIETGLSLLSGLLTGPHTVWAALSTSGLKGLILPSQPRALIIATDGDAAGRAAGTVLAHNATQRGWKVSLMPAPNGFDWNDVLQGEVSL
ncbi:toprim domain-containing protein [Sulfitobacter sp. AS59]|uniref:DUF7146 domain-containing protein n=1 Tax=Sulfitobacter sp. AS59 TaxID=3135784 RepID=UPI00317B8850